MTLISNESIINLRWWDSTCSTSILWLITKLYQILVILWLSFRLSWIRTSILDFIIQLVNITCRHTTLLRLLVFNYNFTLFFSVNWWLTFIFTTCLVTWGFQIRSWYTEFVFDFILDSLGKSLHNFIFHISYTFLCFLSGSKNVVLKLLLLWWSLLIFNNCCKIILLFFLWMFIFCIWSNTSALPNRLL